MIAGPLVLVKISPGNGKDGHKGSSRHSELLLLRNDAQRRERDRLGFRGEKNRLGKGRRAQRCLHTQILHEVVPGSYAAAVPSTQHEP